MLEVASVFSHYTILLPRNSIKMPYVALKLENETHIKQLFSRDVNIPNKRCNFPQKMVVTSLSLLHQR